MVGLVSLDDMYAGCHTFPLQSVEPFAGVTALFVYDGTNQAVEVPVPLL